MCSWLCRAYRHHVRKASIQDVVVEVRTAVIGIWHLGIGIHQLTKEVRHMAEVLDKVRADYKAYAQELKTQRDDAIALAESNATKAAENAAALAAFQADDAATDASQLAAKEAEDAQAFADDLAELKAAPTPVEPEPETPVDTEPAPADGDPVDPVDPTAPVEDGSGV